MAAANTMIAALKTVAGNEWEKQEMCYVTLMKVLEHIIQAPAEQKFRHLRTSNAALRAKLLDVPGTRDFLSAVGFVEEQEGEILAFNPPSCEGLKAALEVLRRHTEEEKMNELRRERDVRIAAAKAEEHKLRPLHEAHLTKERREAIKQELELDRQEWAAEQRLHPATESEAPHELPFGVREGDASYMRKAGGC
uniref:PUB domain-containing protein n=1 Tax=Strombidinopsis acuminata TaxID=141414 RepID=A0A7S3U5Z9_9SPIT